MAFTFKPVSVERYAAICAEVAEGDEPVSAILARQDLERADFDAASIHWDQVLAAEVGSGGEGETSRRYREAFVAAQDALRPLPPEWLEPEAWAALSFAVATEGPAALARRGLKATDQARLSRHFAPLLGKHVALARRYHDAFFKLARSARRSPSDEPGSR